MTPFFIGLKLRSENKFKKLEKEKTEKGIGGSDDQRYFIVWFSGIVFFRKISIIKFLLFLYLL